MKSGRTAFSFVFMGLTCANCMQFFWCYFLSGYLGYDFIMILYIGFCVAGAVLAKRFYDIVQREKREYREQVKKPRKSALERHMELFNNK
jgi:mannose/fructose/N-acetylgalactosamine-specific phosphotransferase system component IIC